MLKIVKLKLGHQSITFNTVYMSNHLHEEDFQYS